MTDNFLTGESKSVLLTEEHKELLKGFLSYLLLIEHTSKLTAQTYLFSVKEFLLWLSKNSISVDKITEKHLTYYCAERRNSGISEQTVAKDISSFRSFCSYLASINVVKENVAKNIDKPKIQKKIPAVLSVEEIDAFLSVINTDKPLGIRDRALYELIYSCGLRISEVSSLLIANVHFDEKIIIVHGKEDKERMVPFGKDGEYWLKKWLYEARPLIVKNQDVPEVFVNSTGKPLSRKGIWKNFQVYEEKSGVKAKVHTLRHSFATHLLAGGADLRSVQLLLGHADLSTTTIYTHVNEEQLESYHSMYFPGHKNVDKKSKDKEKDE